jgi:hypothetical protein
MIEMMNWHKIIPYIPIIVSGIVLVFIFARLAPIAWEQMQEDIRNNITVWRN